MSVFTDGHVVLDSPDTMVAVLRELAGEDALRYRGTVAVWGEQNPPGPARWVLELNDDKGNQTRASLGEHLVLTYGRLLVLSDEEFQAG